MRKTIIVGIAIGAIAALILGVQPFDVQANPTNSAPTQYHIVDKFSGKGAWADWAIEDIANETYTEAYLQLSDRTLR